jgi:NADH-quinone oxidoreductase subunit N
MNATLNSFLAASPEIVVLVMTCLVLLVDSYIRDRGHALAYWLTQSGLMLALFCCTLLPRVLSGRAYFGMVVIDPLAIILKCFVLVMVIVALIYSREYLRPRQWLSGEFFVLVLMVVLGAMVLISAGNLLMIYLGLELLSLSQYALVALHRDAPATAEAAMKYFVLGALASGMLLYGISLVYGMSGTLDLWTLARTLTVAQMDNPVWLLALILIIAGVAFKLGAAPFHMWVPDVYQGATTPVTLLISTAPKLAAYGMAMRLLAMGLGAGAAQWSPILIVLAVASMALGNLIAIAQSDIKRMLAYSTIAHMGFLLLGVLAASPTGYAGAMFYAIVYALMSLGAFGVVILLAGAGPETDRLEEFTGLGRRSPWFALVALILFFSLAGVPPFAGFWAKWFVIKELIHSGHVVVAGLAVFFSVIGAYYYLRIIRLMYFDAGAAASPLATDGDLRLTLSVNGLVILAIGVMPGLLMSTCLRATGY